MEMTVTPPPDLQSKRYPELIDKTAEFVASRGSAIELKIWEKEQGNPKFGFLRPGDPFRPYYEGKVLECVQRMELEEEEEDLEAQLERQEEVQARQYPPSPFYVLPRVLAKVDVYSPLSDIIKLTAQFIAKNGEKFLVGLSDREARNPQYDFLKPTHVLFPYFTALVDAYSLCLLPRVDHLKILQTNLKSRESILQRCLEKYKYEAGQLKGNKTKEELEAEERQQLAMIDWHDFVIVETVELDEGEDLPAPVGPVAVHTLDYTPLDVRTGKGQSREIGNLEEETKKAKEAIAQYQLQEAMKSSAASTPTDIKTRTQKCPVCGDMITAQEFPEHIRLELLDPKFKREKAAARFSDKETVFATGEETTRSLRSMAAHRPDIFDATGESIAVTQSFSLGGKGDDYIPPMNLTGSNKPESAPVVSVYDQVKGLTEQLRKEQVPYQNTASAEDGRDVPRPVRAEMPFTGPGLEPVFTQMPTVVKPLAGQDSQSRSVPVDPQPVPTYEEQSILVPEDQWIRMNPGSITVHIKIPDTIEDWGLRGQIIQLPLDIRHSIGTVKMRLASILSGMPISKMKLKTNEHSVLKDQATLAHYNFTNGTLLDLTVKERGGRRKH